ncbi:cytochrome c [Neorhizobium lilium]|uniref:Cytochrome c n=1 Tax=Neorhizobium lilium TaxID=2503024 RepID=A0A444LMX7_9HYPH|nr:cytochrome c [Neorhizobium lilium]RWX81618.1 cytochrome c [Neorhizobium lilium]
MPLRQTLLCLWALIGTIGFALAQDAPSASFNLIARGRYLAMAADCAACHTAPHGGQPFAGGYAIESPLGAIFSTNITPSKANGIGDYSEQDFARAVREGIAKDGTHLYPAMPFTAYAKISDEDTEALYAYFMHEVKAVDTAPQKTALPFPFNIRASMAAWNVLFLDKGEFKPDASKSSEWNRGAYLAEALGHCGTCHTPRNDLMAEIGTKSLAGGSVGSWYAPNITSDKIAGIGGWSDDELVQYLSTGHVAGKAQAAGPMAEAVENSLQYLLGDDLKALVVYLKDTKPIASDEASPRYTLGTPSPAEAGLRGLPGQSIQENGFHVFSGACAACHQVGGEGTKHYPSLFHSTTTGGDNPDNLIATILFGLTRTVKGMPAFGPNAAFTDRLSDKDIADVSNYVLQHFGNASVTVTPADVVRVRDGGEKPILAAVAPFIVPVIVVVVIILLLVLALFVARRRRGTVTA